MQISVLFLQIISKNIVESDHLIFVSFRLGYSFHKIREPHRWRNG